MIEAGERRASQQLAALLAAQLRIADDERSEFLRLARELPPKARATRASAATTRANARHIAHNLKRAPTRIIGREAEIAALCSLLLGNDVRLLTLTGPAGVGKTRLALAVAAHLLGSQAGSGTDHDGVAGPDSSSAARTFTDGIFLVELAAINDTDLVAPAIANVLQLSESNGLAQAMLTRHLRGRRVLLLLDNFEQVVGAAALVAELLAECPGVALLVTSREPLRLRGEQQFEVAPLPWPLAAAALTADATLQYAAVRLFVERARAVDHAFVPSRENASAIASLCAQVDGLPLAIELLAARVKILPPAALLEQFTGALLPSSLDILAGGTRDLPQRQRTLRAALDWSYNMLNSGEQMLFRRLGAFAAGCTLSSVELVCNARGDLPFVVIDGLQSLLDKSLLSRQSSATTGDRPCYSLLATVREYAAEQLHESGEAASVRSWMVEYYLGLLEAARPNLLGAGQKLWLVTLAAEHSNIRAALRWAISSGSIEVAVQMTLALVGYWYMSGTISEGRHWLEELLAHDSAITLSTALRAELFGAAGSLATAQCDLARAFTLLDNSLVLARQADETRITADSLRNLGTTEILRGNYARAEVLLREVLELWRVSGEHRRVAIALHNLAWIAIFRGDYATAASLETEAIALFDAAGDKWHVGLAYGLKGLALNRQGRFDEADLIAARALAILHGMEGNNGALGLAITCQAEIARYKGDARLAHQLYRESLRQEGNTGSFAPKVFNLIGLCSLAAAEGRAASAAIMLGALAGLADQLGAVIVTPAARPEYEHSLATAKSALEDTQWQLLWSQGGTMSLEELVAFAQQVE